MSCGSDRAAAAQPSTPISASVRNRIPSLYHQRLWANFQVLFDKMRAFLVIAVCAGTGAVALAHGSGAITWNREVSRIVFEKCASCHRPEGTAFSLLTFQDAQPRSTAIKATVLARRMPPWGAVKGFGSFRYDQSLSQEQIELITRWVDGGARRGNNADLLPKLPEFALPRSSTEAPAAVRVSGTTTLARAILLDGLFPERVPQGRSFQIVAILPEGRVEPLLWIHGYDPRFPHPFLLRRPLRLPAGTVIRGVPPDAVIALLGSPAAS